MDQRQFIHEFNKTQIEPFNEEIFTRSSDKIIYYLELMLLSCQRKMGIDGYFTLEIENFEVIDDYKQCQQILGRYLDAVLKRSAKIKAAMDNRYEYIDLKPTDLKLLTLTYKFETYEGVDRYEQIFAIPRIVNKFFVNIYDISDNLYSGSYEMAHARERIKIYESQGFPYEIKKLKM